MDSGLRGYSVTVNIQLPEEFDFETITAGFSWNLVVWSSLLQSASPDTAEAQWRVRGGHCGVASSTVAAVAAPGPDPAAQSHPEPAAPAGQDMLSARTGSSYPCVWTSH